MIFVGLVFVAAGLSDEADPKGSEDLPGGVPQNVSGVVSGYALTWAMGEVGSGIATDVIDVIMVRAAATGSSSYSARAVIVRQDSLVLPPGEPGASPPTLAEVDTSTVATCVEWDVDVSNKTVASRFAAELTRRTGHADLTAGDGDDDGDDENGDGDGDEQLRERCLSTNFTAVG